MEEQPESRQGLQWGRYCPKERATSCQRVSACGGATQAETSGEARADTSKEALRKSRRVINITDQLRRSAKAVAASCMILIKCRWMSMRGSAGNRVGERSSGRPVRRLVADR